MVPSLDADCDGIYVDQDCDDNNESRGSSEFDADCDGVETDEDCDDSNPNIHPYQQEYIGDGIDQDCDGEDLERKVSVGTDHYCVLEEGGEISCGGSDSHGQVSEIPEGTFVDVQSGHYFNCALDITGLITCWGDDQDSKVSDATSWCI